MSGKLWKIFSSIDIPNKQEPEKPIYSVVPIPEFRSYYLGKNSEGCACLLAKTQRERTQLQPPIKLASLRAQFDIPCSVKRKDQKEQEDTFSVILCGSSEQETIRYFIFICENIVKIVGDDPRTGALAASVNQFATIFQKLQKPPSRSLNGLLGELCLIKSSRNPLKALAAWRNEDFARYDFAYNDVRIEVKATTYKSRVHEFSWEQCNPRFGVNVVVASILIDRTSNGITLRSLIEDLKHDVRDDPELIIKLLDVVAGTLGNSINDSLSVRFDMEMAKSTIALYGIEDIPAIHDTPPANVSDIRFRSDLTSVSPHSTDQVLDINPDFWDFLPS